MCEVPPTTLTLTRSVPLEVDLALDVAAAPHIGVPVKGAANTAYARPSELMLAGVAKGKSLHVVFKV